MLILSKKHTTSRERFRQTTHAESTEIRRVFLVRMGRFLPPPHFVGLTMSFAPPASSFLDKTLFNAECGVRN